MTKIMSRWLVILAVVIGTALVLPVMAQSDAGFTIKAQPSANTINRKQDCFNLRVKPNQQQTLTVLITNTDNKIHRIKTTPVSSYTSDNGSLAYKPRVNSSQTNSDVQFTDLVAGNGQTVEVPAGQTRKVQFKLAIPNKKITGMVLGGFQSEAVDNQSETTTQKGIRINNRYSLLLGATVQEQSRLPVPQLKLLTVKSQVDQGIPELVSRFASPVPILFGELKINAKIMRVGSNKIIQQVQSENMTVAPATNFNYRFRLNQRIVTKGKYMLVVNATSGATRWQFHQQFRISKQQVEQLKKGTNKSSYLKMITIIVIIMITFVGVAYFLLCNHIY
ncbi:DUF3324 domain-containing protein [Lentilactobacillus senioris]|uniref:DUF916 domain-containing protein n=1 Tax=Lentilactobacillus senioris TaxID=931534 RepID=UPI00228306C7|nr:DUF916 domain-containing protein [Lentilactobacillus senioris]MCY9807404.1 DUF3324 domain-containing protein [Lentilactobacillus senioris]